MRHSARLRAQSQLKNAADACLGDKRFLFDQIFCNEWIKEILVVSGIDWRERVFSPLVTIWVFINQILSKDHSCRFAVASLIAPRSFQNLPIVSSATGAYCKARARLPSEIIRSLAKGSARRLLGTKPTKWLWKGFEIFLLDGSIVNVQDTKANRKVYKPLKGNGLLKARIVGVFSLSCGSVFEFAIGPWVGKGSGELSMLRTLLGQFQNGHLVIADCLYAGFVDLGLFLAHQLQFVVRASNHQNRQKKKRLGKNDWIVEIPRPLCFYSYAAEYLTTLPAALVVRQVRVIVRPKGFRAKELLIVTSLLDAKQYSSEEIAQLYAKRWNVEVDFRSLKNGLSLDVLRCKKPEMVEKEAWMHILVYNMVRTVMADSGSDQKLVPRQLSFQECVQLLSNFRWCWTTSDHKWSKRYQDLISSLKSRVGNRPDRIEPRLIKHWRQRYRLLKMPREVARRGYWKAGSAYKPQGLNLSA
jgi:hypothetical protein